MSEVQSYCGFQAGGLSFAAAVDGIDEILRAGPMTAVPGAADFILGLMNLRGHVLTVIDLAALLERPRSESRGFVIVARIEGEPYGLFIDRAGDIEQVGPEAVRSAAPVLGPELGDLVEGAYSREDEAVLILDFARCLKRARRMVDRQAR